MEQNKKFSFRGDLNSDIMALELLFERVGVHAKNYCTNPEDLEIQLELNEARVHILASVKKIRAVHDGIK